MLKDENVLRSKMEHNKTHREQRKAGITNTQAGTTRRLEQHAGDSTHRSWKYTGRLQRFLRAMVAGPARMRRTEATVAQSSSIWPTNWCSAVKFCGE